MPQRRWWQLTVVLLAVLVGIQGLMTVLLWHFHGTFSTRLQQLEKLQEERMLALPELVEKASTRSKAPVLRFELEDQESYPVAGFTLQTRVWLGDAPPNRAVARLIVDGLERPWQDVIAGQVSFELHTEPGSHYLQVEALPEGSRAGFSRMKKIQVGAEKTAAVLTPKLTAPTVRPQVTPAPTPAFTPSPTPPQLVRDVLPDPAYSQLPMTDLDRGRPSRPYLALTFDGGSNANSCDAVLDTLRRKNVRATFFLTGKFIELYPQLTGRIVAEGHEVGNHTYDHPHLTSYAIDGRHSTLADMSAQRLHRQLSLTARLFEQTTGARMVPLWRAPFGEINSVVSRWAQELGWRHVAWTTNPGKRLTLDTHDWVADRNSSLYKSPAEIKNKIMRFAATDRNGLGGGIILMHLGSERQADHAHLMLDGLIDEVRQQGYQFTKVTELMARD